MLKHSCTLIACAFMLASCASSHKEGNSKIRINAVRDAAMSYGAQYGLHWESKRVNEFTLSQARTLDKVFNFNGLIMDHNLMPPVVRIMDASLNLPNPEAMRLSDRTIEILRPARFVTTPPSWRHYLIQNFGKVEQPNESLLPKNQHERDIWDAAIVKGFAQGILQSKYIYQESNGKLTQDYVGMVLFKHLLAQNMISKPQVGQARLGITGNRKRIRINDQLMRITSHANLNPNINHWVAAISHTTKD